MREFNAAIIALIVLGGCGEQAGLADRLSTDAIERVEADECAALDEAGEIALAASYFGLADRLRAMAVNPRCPPPLGAPRARLVDWADDGLTSLAQPLRRADWAVTRLSGVFDPSARRAYQHYRGLTATCRRFAGAAPGAWPELIEIYLNDPERQVLPARRRASARLEACAEAYRAAAQDHRSQGEAAWADYWMSFGAALPDGAGRVLLREALNAEPDGEYADFFRLAWTDALLARIEIADFQALATLAADGAIAETRLRRYRRNRLLAAIDAAQAAGFEIHPAWRALERDLEIADSNFGALISSWLRGDGLYADDAPDIFKSLAAACAPGDRIWFFGFGFGDPGPDAGVYDAAGCRRAFDHVGASAGFQSAKAAVLEGELAAALSAGAVDADLIDQLAAYSRDDVARFVLASPSDDFTIDLYDCFRPGSSIMAYWQAAAPGPESAACEALAQAAPGWDSPDELSAVLPFNACDAAALARTDDVRRPVFYAAQTGDPAAFACFAQAAAMEARIDIEIPARDSLLIVVHAGVRLGHLGEADWRAAGGPFAYSPDSIALRSQHSFDHLEDWESGIDPFRSEGPP